MVGKLTSDLMCSCSILPYVMGLSPYKTRNEQLLEMWAHKEGKGKEWEGNENTYFGNLLERTILEEGCRRLGIVPELDITEPVVHPKLPLAASLDGRANGKSITIHHDPSKGIYVVGNDRIVLDGVGPLESKLTRSRAEDFPPMWRGPVQVQGQMMCGGYKWAALIILYGGVEMRIFLFTLHAGTEKSITEACLDLDRRLNADEIEYYDLADAADAALVYSLGDKEEPIDLPAGFDDLCKEYVLLKEQIKDGGDALGVLTAEIQRKMGNHTSGLAGNYRVSWPVKKYREQPEKVIPAKSAYQIRQKTISIKEIKNG